MVAGLPGASTADPGDTMMEARPLDGTPVIQAGAGTPYLRVAAPNYADGLSEMVMGPSPRYISTRVFHDVGQTLFS